MQCKICQQETKSDCPICQTCATKSSLQPRVNLLLVDSPNTQANDLQVHWGLVTLNPGSLEEEVVQGDVCGYWKTLPDGRITLTLVEPIKALIDTYTVMSTQLFYGIDPALKRAKASSNKAKKTKKITTKEIKELAPPAPTPVLDLSQLATLRAKLQSMTPKPVVKDPVVKVEERLPEVAKPVEPAPAIEQVPATSITAPIVKEQDNNYDNERENIIDIVSDDEPSGQEQSSGEQPSEAENNVESTESITETPEEEQPKAG